MKNALLHLAAEQRLNFTHSANKIGQRLTRNYRAVANYVLQPRQCIQHANKMLQAHAVHAMLRSFPELQLMQGTNSRNLLEHHKSCSTRGPPCDP